MNKLQWYIYGTSLRSCAAADSLHFTLCNVSLCNFHSKTLKMTHDLGSENKGSIMWLNYSRGTQRAISLAQLDLADLKRVEWGHKLTTELEKIFPLCCLASGPQWSHIGEVDIQDGWMYEWTDGWMLPGSCHFPDNMISLATLLGMVAF